MALGREKSKRSWQRLSFRKQQTKASQLSDEQRRSHRVWRLTQAAMFAALVTLLAGFGREPALTVSEWVGLGALITFIHAMMMLVVRAYHPEIPRNLPRYLAVVGFALVVARLLQIPAELSPFMLPLPLLALMLTVIFSGSLALHTCVACAVIFGVLFSLEGGAGSGGSASGTSLIANVESVVLVQLVGAIVAILGAARIRTRTRLVVVGLLCGIAQAVAIVVAEVLQARDLGDMLQWGALSTPAWGLLNGLATGVLFTSALPFLERWFDLTTDMRLLELADQNRPLLREFSILAPGSFQHSLVVGQLAEVAAQSIGANDLLARVGAMYHDIGKMRKPNYFVENQAGDENVHDRLSPEMSRLIIISHVKDGIQMAEEERLPQPLVDMIPMHHGTSVVEFFYHKKKQREEEQGIGEETGNEAFQYPGPKPTFREAGILMLADTVEAVSRVVQDPSHAKLRTKVRELVRKKMEAGQLDESQLTLQDLSRIQDAFVRVLTAIHHGRIKYPKQEETDKEAAAEGASEGEVTAAVAEGASAPPGAESAPGSGEESPGGEADAAPAAVTGDGAAGPAPGAPGEGAPAGEPRARDPRQPARNR